APLRAAPLSPPSRAQQSHGSHPGSTVQRHATIGYSAIQDLDSSPSNQEDRPAAPRTVDPTPGPNREIPWERSPPPCTHGPIYRAVCQQSPHRRQTSAATAGSPARSPATCLLL